MTRHPFRTALAAAALLFLAAASCGAADLARPPAPEPRPVASDVLVGCYYFPGWNRYGAWKVLNDFPMRKPLLGYYREGDPGVADWHIAWAAEHGIGFFIYDWYWAKGGRHLEHALHDGFMKARLKKNLRFALLWANHDPPGSTSVADLQAVADYWVANYFRDPQYQTINGKPLVVIFNPYRIREDLGGPEGARKGLDALRQRVRDAGLPGIFLAACAYPQHDIKALLSEGYDAATGYNYPSAGMKDSKKKEAPYDDMIGGFEGYWRAIREKGIDYIPIAEAGWDSRPWHGADALVRTGKHPAKFKTMLERAQAFIEQSPPKERPKMVFIEAWNEFGEGDYIEPHREFGFGYLDAIREVFCPKAGPHVDTVPGGAGLAPDDFQPNPRTAWTFETAGDMEGWAPQSIEGLAARGGILVARSTNADPAVTNGDVDFDAGAFRKLVFRMRVDKGKGGQVFWSGPGTKLREEASVRVPIQADGQWHDYSVDLGSSAAWAGRIAVLRIDMTDVEGAAIEMDDIRMEGAR